VQLNYVVFALIKVKEITMAFIKNNTYKVGEWVVTSKEHSALNGTFTVGSRVKIVDIDPMRGYAIEDKHGNRIVEIGWVI
jgi:uncharacterized protein (DUF2062 family)